MSHFDNFVGTREVSDTHRFDVNALQTWLQEHMPSLHHVLLRCACMHFPLLCYKAHSTLFAHTHSQIVR